MFAAKIPDDAGVFTVWANNDTTVLQFLPPLTSSDERADELIAVVRRCFGTR